ncbi:MAG: DUF624 domain-containing protein [Spirochaetaceae bacterium]|jgi:uncharacterized membrane protein YesL|nr:DUF624 domain-containing protein [Spirochaetaceae bacterium]
MKQGKAKKRLKKRLFEDGVYAWMEKLFDAVSLNLLWLLCSLPLVTIGASSTAFYYTMAKVIRGERGHLFGEFWRSFRLNFVKATIVWIAFAALIFLLLVNRNISADIAGSAGIGGYFGFFLLCLYTVIAVLFLGVLVYVFPVLSRFYMAVPQVIKLSVYMCFRYLPYTLGLLAICAGAAVMISFLPLLVICVPAGALFCFSQLMESLLVRHTPVDTKGEDRWYLDLAPREGKNT